MTALRSIKANKNTSSDICTNSLSALQQRNTFFSELCTVTDHRRQVQMNQNGCVWMIITYIQVYITIFPPVGKHGKDEAIV